MGAGQSQDSVQEQRYEEPTNTLPQSSNTDVKDNQNTTEAPVKANPIATEAPARAPARANQTKAEAPLPHNYEEILKHADSPVDRTSREKLYEQLHAGVYLNQKKKKFWVEKESKRNCFTLFAPELLITWADDPRFWHWPLLKDSSGESHTAAELVNVCWLEVHGRFEIANLSPETVYQVVFVVKLRDPAYGWDVPVNLRLTLPDGTKQEHKENLMEKQRERWIELPAGEFKTSVGKVGEMEISMYEYEGGKWKRGLLVKGIIIRPKAT